MNYDAYNAGLSSVKNYKKSNLGRNSFIGAGIAGILALGTLVYNNTDNISDVISGTAYALNPQNHLPKPNESLTKPYLTSHDESQASVPLVKTGLESMLPVKEEISPDFSGYEICKGQNVLGLDNSKDYLEILNKGMENSYGANTGCEFTNNWYSNAVALLNDMKNNETVESGSYQTLLNTTNALNNELN